MMLGSTIGTTCSAGTAGGAGWSGGQQWSPSPDGAVRCLRAWLRNVQDVAVASFSATKSSAIVFESTVLAMLSLARPCSAHGEGSRHLLPLKVHLASLGYRLPLRRNHAWSTIPARASVIGISGLTDPLSVTAGSARTMLETSTHPTTPNTSDVPTVSPNLRGKLMLVRTKNTNAPTAAHRTASIST
jgi:hypothetical protein